MAIRPVNRIKHVVDFSATLPSGTNLEVPLVSATDTPTLADTTSVLTGSKVNGIFLSLSVASNEASVMSAIPNCYMYIIKNVGGNLGVIDPAAVGTSDNKRFVIHQEMVMFENQNGGNTKTLFKGVIVIPKGYRRFAPNDLLEVVIRSPTIDITFCLQCHYKEFR